MARVWQVSGPAGVFASEDPVDAMIAASKGIKAEDGESVAGWTPPSIEERVEMDRAHDLGEIGARWAREDLERAKHAPGLRAPCARWGNTQLDRAYDEEWKRLTNEVPRR